jgi:hypothetical protein
MWEKWAPTGEFVFTQLSPGLQADFLRMLIEGENGVNTYMASAIINGNIAAGTAPLNKFDGLIVKALADADVVDVAGAAALTSANIIDKLQDVYDASRVPLRRNVDYKIMMSEVDHEKYREALVTLSYKSIDPTMAAPLLYHGKKIVVLTDLPENTIIATQSSASRKSNIWLGVRGKVDQTTIKVDLVQNNSDLWFFKMKMAADTQIKWGQDLVLYKP